MAHAHCMLGNHSYKHALITLLTYIFHGNNGYANAPQIYVYRYTACLIPFRNTLSYKTYDPILMLLLTPCVTPYM